jgi:hypothetical protein
MAIEKVKDRGLFFMDAQRSAFAHPYADYDS